TAAHAGTRRPGREAEPLPPSLDLELLLEHREGLVCLSGCARHGLAVRNPNTAAEVARSFGRERFFVELQRPFERGDAGRNALLRDLAAAVGVETLVTGDAHAHDRRRTELQDALVAVRHRTSLDGCERERRGNRESARPPGRGAEAHRRPRPGRFLPLALGGAGARARAGDRGARARLAALDAATRPWPRQLRRLDRLLPDGPLPRRSGLGRALPRAL